MMATKQKQPKRKPKKKESLTISEAASIMNCSDVNIYYHIKEGNLKTIDKATYIQTTEGGFVPTGEHKTYIIRKSIEDRLNSTEKRKTKGRQVKAVYLEGVDKVFKNGKKEIIFPSETVAAIELKIGKFALRGRLDKMTKGGLVHGEIKVSVLKKDYPSKKNKIIFK